MGQAIEEIVFVVEEAPEGGYTVRALGASIFTEADDLESLRKEVVDAVRCHFEGSPSLPRLIRLPLVKDEVLSVWEAEGDRHPRRGQSASWVPFPTVTGLARDLSRQEMVPILVPILIYVRDQLAQVSFVMVKTTQVDIYGRCLNQELLDRGLARLV